jgi:hypothetical protein
MNSWISYVKQVQKQHNCSYKEALIIASKTYKKGGSLKAFTNAFKKMGNDLRKGGEKMQRGFNRIGEKLNPFNDDKFKKGGAKLGDVTHEELVPIVQQVGTEVYKKGLNVFDPITMGMSSKMGNLLFDKMGKKYIRQPKSQISRNISNVGKVAVELYPTKPMK